MLTEVQILSLFKENFSLTTGNESGGNTAPGVYLREDPICGTQLENQSELRAPTAERAAYYLDAAIAARTIPGTFLPNHKCQITSGRFHRSVLIKFNAMTFMKGNLRRHFCKCVWPGSKADQGES